MIDISYFQIDMLIYQIFLLSFLDDNQFLYTNTFLQEYSFHQQNLEVSFEIAIRHFALKANTLFLYFAVLS